MSVKGAVRSVKNYAKGYSDLQSKVREATSNDPWGPSGTLMNEIAQATHNPHDFMEIMEMIDKRLNDKGKNWRHVFKALTLLDYCLHVGSDSVVVYAKENTYIVKTLKEFQHIDENGKDCGANVRQKAKDITNLLQDDARLKEERRRRVTMQNRMAGREDAITWNTSGMPDSTPTYEKPGFIEEESNVQKAIEESKRTAELEARNRSNADEDDLALAIRLSEKEAKEKEKAKKARENEANLLGDFTNNNAISSQPTGFNQFQTPQQQYDFLGNPIYTQQPQQTGNGMTLLAQPTGSNPYLQQQLLQQQLLQQQQQQQQQQQELLQQEALRQQQQLQQEALRQHQLQEEALRQHQLQEEAFRQQQMQQQLLLQQQQQQEQLRQQQLLQQQFQQQQLSNPYQSQLQPQTTGFTSNPFGQFGQASTIQPQSTGFASSTSLSPSSSFSASSTGFGSGSFGTLGTSTTPNLTTISSPTIQSPSMTASSLTTSAPRANAADEKHAKLAALLGAGPSRGDGMDTFGNVGNLRVPVGSGFATTSNDLSPKSNQVNPFFNGQSNDGSNNLLGSSNGLGFSPLIDTSPDSTSSGSFGQPVNRNPFGQAQSSSLPWTSPKPINQKTLSELQAERQQQQFLQTQQTGFSVGFGQQPQTNTFNGSLF